MKRLLIMLCAGTALALPTSAYAHGGHHGRYDAAHFRAFAGRPNIARLTGTGTSFGASTAGANGSTVARGSSASGSFAFSLTTTWSQASSKTFALGTVSCAPATATLTLSGADATTASLSGKTCSWTPSGGSAVYGFFGRDTATGVSAIVKEAPNGAVAGVTFVGSQPAFPAAFFGARRAAAMANCPHH